MSWFQKEVLRRSGTGAPEGGIVAIVTNSKDSAPTPVVYIQILRIDAHFLEEHTQLITRQIFVWGWSQGISCVVWSYIQTLSSDLPLQTDHSLKRKWPFSHMLFLLPSTMSPYVCHKMVSDTTHANNVELFRMFWYILLLIYFHCPPMIYELFGNALESLHSIKMVVCLTPSYITG